MKRIIIILFVFLSLPLYSQNFRINAGGTYTLFSNINDRKVSFYGFGINYSYYLYKRAGLFISYDHYLPVTYYGMVTSDEYDPNSVIPVYITGGANAMTFGFRMKIIDPDSKRIEVNGTIAFSSFRHKGSYHIEELVISDRIFNKVRSLYTGLELVLKNSVAPLAISLGYNFVANQKGYKIDNFMGYFSVPFPSYPVLKVAISLPVMRGPAPSQIKQIEF